MIRTHDQDIGTGIEMDPINWNQNAGSTTALERHVVSATKFNERQQELLV